MTGTRVYKILRTVEKKAQGPLVLVLAYEAVAVRFPASGLPTVSQLGHRHRWLWPVTAVLIGVHIWYYEGGS